MKDDKEEEGDNDDDEHEKEARPQHLGCDSDKEEDFDDTPWPTNIVLSYIYGQQQLAPPFVNLGAKLKINSEYISYVGAEHHHDQSNDFIHLIIDGTCTYGCAKLNALIESLHSSDFDAIRDKIVSFSLISCTILVNDISEISEFAKVLSSFPRLQEYRAGNSSWSYILC